jgi:colanic acid/amylovoran biosynthesis glycosyltransferase
MRVAYILKNFPVLSETFIIQEVRDHLEAGVDLSVIALGFDRSRSTSLDSIHRRLPQCMRYLGLPRRRSAQLWSLARKVCADPGALTSALKVWRQGRLSDALVAASLSATKPRYDVIHCHFGTIGQIASLMRRHGLISGKLVVTVHGFDISQGELGFAEDYYKDLFDHTDCLLPVSDHWKAKLESMGADPAKVRVHRMGVDVQKLRPVSCNSQPSVFRLCSIGRFVEKKGHLFSLRALARVKERRPDIDLSFQLVGNGPLLPEAQALVQTLGLSGIVEFLGGLDHASALALLAESDAFILPSITASDGNMEGVPVSIMEAMALQKPVISTWHSGIPELVEHGVSGLLVPEQDVETLSRAIEVLADNPAERARLGAAGRLKVERSFNAATLGNELRAVYAAVVEGKRPGADATLDGKRAVQAPMSERV